MEKIKINIGNFEESNNNSSLWSTINIEINEQVFPSKLWSDAASAVLEMWAHNLCGLILGSVNRCNLDFMDGDYSIQLNSNNNHEVTATCIDPHNNVVISATIDLLYFARQILRASEKMKLFYTDHSDSRALNSLMYEVDKLRHIAGKYKLPTDT